MISEHEPSAAEPCRLWRAGSREILLDRPIVAGILNVTPDSFSDGGNFFSPEKAVERAAQMIAEGADIIDVGGESTRPGATVVDVGEEMRRAVPVVREIRKRSPNVLISIDTTKASVAKTALEAGADIVNDVSAFRLDPEMPGVVRESGCGVVLMHSRGGIEDMASYAHADYAGNAVMSILDELVASADAALAHGIDRERIALDPGFGFSKLSAQSMALLSQLNVLVEFGFPVFVGTSRKRFVTEAMLRPSDNAGDSPKAAALSLEDRDVGTAAVNVVAMVQGARIFRVHNVRVTRRALDAAWRVIRAPAIDDY
ncbi:MAG TPA: dihydropteroate synthase [Gemmatimonadaceae bacterium]|nr:dihydropteroate synthase [Gemmatimonadaceae bacterium]